MKGGGLYAKLPIVDTKGKDGRLLASSLKTELSGTTISKNYGDVGGGVNYEGEPVSFRTSADKQLITGNEANVKGGESADFVEGCNYGEA